MNIKRTLVINALVAATLAAASMSASADEMRGGERHNSEMRGSGWHGGDWHGPRGPWHGDFRHFDRHDYRLWRGGSWRQSWHDGRFGWWWIAGGEWFFYSQPVYPYPDPYAYVPTQTIVVQPSPPQTIAPQPAQQLWYFCASANGYYPYVPSCPGGWQAVPATPTHAPPAAPPATLPAAPPGYAPPANPPAMVPGSPPAYALPAPPVK